MRHKILMTMAAIICRAAFGAEDHARLTIYVLNEGVADIEVNKVARALAATTLSGAGISILWRSGKARNAAPGPGITVQMCGRTPKDYHPGALAFARPFDQGGDIEVFYWRIWQAVPSELVGVLLGHVLVHEITHVLQGTDRHTQEGIMKAYWDANDYRRMRFKLLAFTQTDIDLIHKGFAHKQQMISSNR